MEEKLSGRSAPSAFRISTSASGYSAFTSSRESPAAKASVRNGTASSMHRRRAGAGHLKIGGHVAVSGQLGTCPAARLYDAVASLETCPTDHCVGHLEDS